MNTKFYRLGQGLPSVSINIFKLLTGKKAIYPFYHTISDNDILHIKHLYPVRTVKQFECDLEFLLKHYQPVDIHTILAGIRNGKQANKNTFLLSFDDGLSEFHDVIAPILLKKGIPAICFLNSGFIDNKDLFFRYKASVLIEYLKRNNNRSKHKKELSQWFQNKQLKQTEHYNALLSVNYLNKDWLDELAGILEIDFNEYLKDVKPYMSSDQIHDLIKQGFHFGAHSIDHPQYSEITVDEQLLQTKESIDNLCSIFNLSYKAFSFPFTDYGVSNTFFNQVFQAGKIADITFGCAGLKNDSYFKNIQRIPIEINTFSAKNVIIGEHLYFLLKALLCKNTIKRP